MIRVAPGILVDESEIQVRFVRASGPGGQNVNKVATAAELRFDVAASRSLPAEIKSRLARLAGRRMSSRGILVLDARRHRSAERNRQEAVRRLVELVRRAAEPPKVRRATRPTAASRLRRLAAKRRRSDVKGLRRDVGGE